VLAADGFDLVVAAEDAGIEDAAIELRGHGGAVRPVRTDLRTVEGVEELYATWRAMGPVDLAALNAGVGQGGPFAETDIAADLEIIELNITSTVRLAKKLVRDMLERGEGRILVTSSIASTMPGSFQAVYNASKSFVQSELRDTPVTVTSVMPGPTETEFFQRADMDDTKVGSSPKDDPALVARQGYEAVMAGKDKTFAGSASTKAKGVVNALLPDRLKAALHKRMAEPGSGR
jgi:short-subunit dehydrogenase